MNIVYLISKLQTLKIAHSQLESKKLKITNKEKEVKKPHCKMTLLLNLQSVCVYCILVCMYYIFLEFTNTYFSLPSIQYMLNVFQIHNYTALAFSAK